MQAISKFRNRFVYIYIGARRQKVRKVGSEMTSTLAMLFGIVALVRMGTRNIVLIHSDDSGTCIGVNGRT